MTDDTIRDVRGTYGSWAEWIFVPSNAQASEDVRLTALRAFIEAAAKTAVDNGDITAQWANKKLPALGVAAQFATGHTYSLEAPAAGTYKLDVYADSRTEALREFARRTAAGYSIVIENPSVTGDAVFTKGPEDPTPGALPDDAPDTVDATLVALRETILLGIIAGPRYCEAGASDVLDDFALGNVPERKTYVVTRPVTAVAETTVEAFDEVSAARVASWRWDNDQVGYNSRDLAAGGDLTVSVK